MRLYTSLYFKIYITGKPMRHIGMVEAVTPSEALEKAGKGVYRDFWGTDAERTIPVENLTATI